MYSEMIFYVLLLLVAFLYGSVGHGGASGYLALMTLFSFAPLIMRPTSLLLNILISAVAFIQYYRGGYFKWKLFWPFAVASIPAAFIGGLYILEDGIYKKVLAGLLILSVVKLLGFKQSQNKPLMKQYLSLSLIFGAVIGLFSGMIGIGGGIILSPLILLLNWADLKQTAAVSALFIFTNSIAGFGGLLTSGIKVSTTIWLMLAIAFIGGLAGAYLGANKFNTEKLKFLLSFVLVMAAVKLYFT